MQHQSTIIIFPLIRPSTVDTILKAIIQTKKTTCMAILLPKILLQRNCMSFKPLKNYSKCVHEIDIQFKLQMSTSSFTGILEDKEIKQQIN